MLCFIWFYFLKGENNKCLECLSENFNAAPVLHVHLDCAALWQTDFEWETVINRSHSADQELACDGRSFDEECVRCACVRIPVTGAPDLLFFLYFLWIWLKSLDLTVLISPPSNMRPIPSRFSYLWVLLLRHFHSALLMLLRAVPNWPTVCFSCLLQVSTLVCILLLCSGMSMLSYFHLVLMFLFLSFEACLKEIWQILRACDAQRAELKVRDYYKIIW